MLYREFGSTGRKVSALGFGAMHLPAVDFEQARQTLHYALDHGINYIDTAAAYRNSEEIIGNAIAERRDEYFLATKTAQREYEGAKQEIERSLQRLKTDHIDLLQLHYVNRDQEFSLLMSENGAYRAAVEARKAGKIHFIGITGHRPDRLSAWISKGEFDQVLFHLSLVQPFANQELIPAANHWNMAKTAMKPLSGGFVQPVRDAIRYTYSQDVDTLISGMSSVEEVKENLEAVAREVEAEEHRVLEAKAEKYGAHDCRRCNYCKCPVEISIPDVMISSVIREHEGLLPKGEAWYEKNKGKLLSCESYDPCKIEPICEKLCPYELPMQTVIQRTAKSLQG